MKRQLKNTFWLGLFITVLTVLIAPYAALLALANSDKGDMFDRFEVLSSLQSPDGQTIAVVYRYHHAELSSEGISVWLQEARLPIEGSDSGWPKGRPAFTMVNAPRLPAFRWTANDRIEVDLDPAMTVRPERDSSHCFWRDGSDHEDPTLCVHSDWVTAKPIGQATPAQ